MFLLHTLIPMLFFGGLFYEALQSKDIFDTNIRQNCTQGSIYWGGGGGGEASPQKFY